MGFYRGCDFNVTVEKKLHIVRFHFDWFSTRFAGGGNKNSYIKYLLSSSLFIIFRFYILKLRYCTPTIHLQDKPAFTYMHAYIHTYVHTRKIPNTTPHYTKVLAISHYRHGFVLLSVLVYLAFLQGQHQVTLGRESIFRAR